MISSRISRNIEEVEGNCREEKCLVDEDLGVFRLDKILINRQLTQLQRELIPCKFLLVIELPQPDSVRVVNQANLVQVANIRV